MIRILGIDPGSQVTGYGVVDFLDGKIQHVDSGCIRTGGGDFPERLAAIFTGLSDLIETHRPTEVAVEQVFVHRNPDSALKLGQARGAALCAVVRHGLPVSEYAPRRIKQAVTGTGGAAKEQVQRMVVLLLGLDTSPQADAADALAAAICHSNTRQTLGSVGQADGTSGANAALIALMGRRRSSRRRR